MLMMRLRRRSEDGQSTLEWLGVGAVVVALAAALVLSAPGMSGSLAETFTCLIGRLVGQSCAAETARGPEEPCVLQTQSTTGELGIKVVAVNIDGTHGYVTETLSDGTVRVTEMTRLEGGPSVSVGAGVAVNTGDGSVGARARASLRGNAFVEFGDTWTFPDQANADAWIENQLVDTALGSNPVTGNPVGGWIAGGALDLIGVGGNDVDGEQTSTRIDIGVNGEALAEAVGGPLAGEGRATLEAAGSVTQNSDGSVELGFGLTGELAASLGLPIAGSLGGDGTSAGSVAVTVQDGQVTNVEVALAVTAPEGTIVPGQAQSPADVLTALGNAAVDPDVPNQEHLITLNLDTTDPALRGSVDALLDGLGNGQLDQAALGTLGDSLVDASEATYIVNELRGTETYGIDAHASFIVGGRLAANLVTEGSDLVSAMYWDPVSGSWQPWTACTGG